MREITYQCQQCLLNFTKKVKGTFKGKFCSTKCQHEFRGKQRLDGWLIHGQLGWTGKTKSLRRWVRRYIRELKGTACEECGWDGRHPSDGSVLTEIDHIDGDASNCIPTNLKVLCPNCHSMTPTFRARNKNSTRDRS